MRTWETDALTLSERFQVPRGVHVRRFDDEMILLHLGIGSYFSLDAVGATIWERLSGGGTGSDAVLAVLSEYEIDEATARADVERLAGEFLASGLLERSAQ
jgi:hypothetical protein